MAASLPCYRLVSAIGGQVQLGATTVRQKIYKKLKPMQRIICLFLLIISVGCTKKSTPSEQIKTYYEGFKNGDYITVKRTLADSLITVEGDYTTAFSRGSYYEQFKWDSVFKPVYKLVGIENQGEHPIATVAVHSSKFEFLKNNPLTIRHKFYFKSGKIAKIETLDFIDFNGEAWEKEKKALMDWVKLNHPELDGFIYDLTMKGAIDYVHAMELYKQRQSNVPE